MRASSFYGRRRQLPMLGALTLVSAVLAITARTVAGAVFEVGLALWLGATAWRNWREPVAPRAEVGRARHRAGWLGSHPVRGALLGAVLIATALYAGFSRRDFATSLAVCGAFGGLIGFGLYFVFRTDPNYHHGDNGAYDPTGRRRMEAPHWMRRSLEAPDEIESVWVGPPDLRLDRREQLLVMVRNEIAARGLALEEVRTRRRVRATGSDALRRLQRDEETAEQREHWWTMNVVWRSPDGPSVVVYSPDYDGHDVMFAGWGPAAAPCLAAVDDLLSSEGRP